MQLRILGCSGSISRGSHTTSMLVDDDVLIDAGTGVGELTLEEMMPIKHVFLTHSHLDHLASLPAEDMHMPVPRSAKHQVAVG